MNELIPEQKATATAYKYKGELEYDEEGNITNELIEVQTFEDVPVERIEVTNKETE